MDDSNTQAELARLRLEVRQYQEFLDGLPDALIEIDLKTTRILAINLMTTILMGFTVEDVERGIDARDMATPAEIGRMVELSRAFIRSGLERGSGQYQRKEKYEPFEFRLLRRDGTEFDAEVQSRYILDESARPIRLRTIVRDISERKAEERARQETIAQLNDALAKVKTLSGFIPICAWCRRIRDDHGYWQKIETYVREHSDADFTHSICESCSARMTSEQEGTDLERPGSA